MPLLPIVHQLNMSFPCFSSFPRTGGLLSWSWQNSKRQVYSFKCISRPCLQQSFDYIKHTKKFLWKLGIFPKTHFLSSTSWKFLWCIQPRDPPLLVSCITYFLSHLTKIFHNISFKVNYFQWIIIFYIW